MVWPYKKLHKINSEIKAKEGPDKILTVVFVLFSGSWVVTCGMESGVVRFIEEAIDAHVAMKKNHIPIVGILSNRVNTAIINVSPNAFITYIVNVACEVVNLFKPLNFMI